MARHAVSFLWVFAAAACLAGCGMCDESEIKSLKGSLASDYILVETNCGATADYAYQLRKRGEDENLLVFEASNREPVLHLTASDDAVMLRSPHITEIFVQSPDLKVHQASSSTSQ